jgi:hypothetical protein
MAMGNYPFPSSYILNGNGELPAFPVRVACEYLAEEGLEGTPLLTAFADSLGVFYNYSQVPLHAASSSHLLPSLHTAGCAATRSRCASCLPAIALAIDPEPSLALLVWHAGAGVL